MTIPEASSATSVKSKKSTAVNLGLFALGMVLLGWSIYSNRTQLKRCLAGELHYSWMFQAFLLHLLGVMIAFLRWFGLVRLQGIQIPLADSLRLSIVGGLFNLIIPGAVGGDLVKAAYLSRMDIPRTRVIASMVIDRLLGLLGLFLLAAFAGLSAWPTSDLPVRRLTIAVLIATSAIIVFLALIFSGIVGRKSEKLAELNAMSAAYRNHLTGVMAWTIASVFVHIFNTMAFHRMSLAILPQLKMCLFLHLNKIRIEINQTPMTSSFVSKCRKQETSSSSF